MCAVFCFALLPHFDPLHLSLSLSLSVCVSGTPWMVVWTSDRRQFFFDVTSRVSLWIMPEELKDNPLVEKIIDDGPDGEGEGHLHMGTSRI